MPHTGASIPTNERERLDALERLDVLDTFPEAAYDDIVQLASHICSTPISLVSLVDAKRQWFKAKVGLDVSQTDRDLAFCGYALSNPTSVLVVEDATKDARFKDSPLVLGPPYIRFYAGAPIVVDRGQVVGTVCVIDTVPRRLVEAKREALRALAKQAAKFLQMRELALINGQLASSLAATVSERDRALEQAVLLAREIDHRVMNSLHMTLSFLELQAGEQRGTDAHIALQRAAGCIRAIADVHQHLCLEASSELADATVYLARLCKKCSEIFDFVSPVEVMGPPVYVDTDSLVSLGLVVNELVTNSCKSGAQRVSVRVKGKNGNITSLSVMDDGGGPSADFSLGPGKGLGMKMIQALARKLGGEVSLKGGPNGKGALAVLHFESAGI